MINIRLVQEKDLAPLSMIYKALYNNSSVLNENWTEESAFKLLYFYYTSQPDIFVIAEEDGVVVGAVMSLVKPWYNGNRLIETEIIVTESRQHCGIASKMFKEHFKRASDIYDVKTIEAHTFQDERGYPLKWYKKQGYTIDNNLLVINGNIPRVLSYFMAH